MTIRKRILSLIIVYTWLLAASSSLEAARTTVAQAAPNWVRDNFGTSSGLENDVSSQALVNSALASPFSFPAEGMGFEPTCNSVASDNVACGCEKCQEARAALALHPGCFKWLELALNDADLQRVIEAWGGLPEAIRRAMLALVGSIG
jgi:hypothetical protein